LAARLISDGNNIWTPTLLLGKDKGFSIAKHELVSKNSEQKKTIRAIEEKCFMETILYTLNCTTKTYS